MDFKKNAIIKSINKLFWLKHKRVILIVCAVVFLAFLFLIKNGLIFKDKEILGLNKETNGLSYGNTTVAELVVKDTDYDGVADWEEGLWGLDPNNKETTPGVPDITTANKLKNTQSFGADGEYATENENLTQTDKFSRELFSTLAALNQAGAMDQTAVDKISESLANHIQNPVQRKIFTASDIKIKGDNSKASIKKYGEDLSSIYKKYPVQGNVIEILSRFIVDENNADLSVLKELDPIISQIKARGVAIMQMNVPSSLSDLHLKLLNSGEKVLENLLDMTLYDTDPITALGGITQYEKNAMLLISASASLENAISKNLSN